MLNRQLINQGAALRVFIPREFLALVADAPERTGQTIKEIARRMGESNPNHLGRQLNPDDGGAKLGIEEFVYFMATTDLLPLHYVCRAFGLVVIEVPASLPGAGIIAAKAADAAMAFGEWLKDVGSFTAPDSASGSDISPAEARQLIEEGDKVMAVFFSARAFLEEKAKGLSTSK